MENEKIYAEQKIIDIMSDKKAYNFNEDNFVMPHELTVTITLNEYRRLIEDSSSKDIYIDKMKTEKWELKERIKELEKNNKKLFKKLSNLVDGNEVKSNADNEEED